MVPASEIEDYLRNFDLSDEAEEERRAECQRLKALSDEKDALTALAAEARVARKAQDDDFHALLVTIGFQIHGFDGQEFYEDHDPSLWEFSEDGGENSKIGANIVPQVLAALAPLVAHYEALGLVPLSSSRNGPQFCLVYRPDAEGTSPENLAQMPNVMVDLQGQPGATLELSVWHSPLNATAAFDESDADDVDVGHWGGATASTLNRQAGEARDQWLARVAMPARTIARTVERWEVSGRNPLTYALYGNASERPSADAEISWLVEGRIPRGAITLLAGNGGAGKSSFAHEWISALGGKEVSRPRSILGGNVSGRFVAALIAREEDTGDINFRAARHATIWGSADYVVMNDVSKSLEYYLDLLLGMPVVDLVVIDPLRAVFNGDEKSPGDVRAFCAPLLKLARAKRCAVVLVHHITKGSVKDAGAVRSLAELRVRIGGSAALVDAARMTIGMIERRGGAVEVGPVKYNYPAEKVWLPVCQGLLYRKNPETFTLDLIPPGDVKEGPGSLGQPADVSVRAAIDRCNRTANIVRKSGKSGLFESKPPELAGLSRASILDAIGALESRGEITDGEAGLHITLHKE